MEEVWETIPEFRDYQVSNYGNIFNTRRNIEMSVSYTNHGHPKISLTDYATRERGTRAVAKLVAEAFVAAPNELCDQVIFLDGDRTNFKATNLRWRPEWFAWKYTRQLTIPQPLHYRNLPVVNVHTDQEYDSIIEAGTTEGLLFADIWRSTYTGIPTFPEGFIFEIIERV